MATDLYLLGSGIRGSLQLTVETIQALSVCHTAYVLHDDLCVHEEVKEHCHKVVDLAELYEGEFERKNVYQRISETVIEAAMATSGVAFVCHGHPLFLVSASELMLKQARNKGLTARALPAVSSLDTILCDLGLDIIYNVQLFDATVLLTESFSLNNRVPVLVFNLASCMDDNVVKEAPKQDVLSPLVEFLSQSYPAKHNCKILYSASQILDRSEILDITIAELDTSSQLELWRRPTLYVPETI